MRRNAERGASFIIALVLLLVCTVVATVIVTSASVSVERSRKTTEEQQAYFAVSSAIQAARELCTTKGPIADLVLTRPDASSDFSAGATSDGSELATWALGAANVARSGGRPEKTFTVAGFKHENADVPAVDLTFSMVPAGGAEQYKIKITARLADNVDHSDYAQAISTTIAVKSNGDTALYWGPGPKNTSDENAPDLGETVYNTPYMSDVWGTVHDAWWEKQWKKCTWKATANSDLFVASNPSHYIVTIYYQGSYYIPVCDAPGAGVYYGRAMAAKVIDETSLSAMPANGPSNCERRLIEADGTEPEGTTKNTSTGFSITWKKVS